MEFHRAPTSREDALRVPIPNSPVGGWRPGKSRACLVQGPRLAALIPCVRRPRCPRPPLANSLVAKAAKIRTKRAGIICLPVVVVVFPARLLILLLRFVKATSDQRRLPLLLEVENKATLTSSRRYSGSGRDRDQLGLDPHLSCYGGKAEDRNPHPD